MAGTLLNMSFLHFDYAQCKLEQESRFHTRSPPEADKPAGVYPRDNGGGDDN